MEHGAKTRSLKTFHTNIDAQNGIQIHDRGRRKLLRQLEEDILTGKASGSGNHVTSFGDTKVNQETSP